MPVEWSVREPLFQPFLDADEEMMGQNTLRHMVVPTHPRTDHVITHSQVIFAVFQSSLHWPAHSSDACQFSVRRSCWCNAEVRLKLGLFSQRATHNQPRIGTWQFVTHFNDASEGKLGDRRSFATFFNQKSHVVVLIRSGNL